jgi:hypothetical protein
MKKILVTVLLLFIIFLSVPAINIAINEGIEISDPVVGQSLPGSNKGGGGTVTINGWCDSGPWWW